MASKKKKRRRRIRNDRLVLRLLVLVVIVLVVFEGKMIRTMFFSNNDNSGIAVVSDKDVEPVSEGAEPDAATVTSDTPVTTISGDSSLLVGADLSGGGSSSTQETQAAVLDQPVSDKILTAQATPVDDSYFSDAVFIGDSRMAGFQNASGITQGDFLASVGMSVDQFSNAKVQTPSGNITVYQGLSGKQYKKIYIMLGANDLGYYPWENFKSDVENILRQIHQLQPSAVIYFCSCIYVEESKVTTDYVNNQNVQTVNTNLIAACEDLSYCYFINLNEIFDNGYHQLIEGASQDGVHLYENYLKQMLEYLRTHYIAEDMIPEIAASAPVVNTTTTDVAASTSSTDDSSASGTTLVGTASTGN